MRKKLLSLCVSMLILAPVTRVSAGLLLHWKLDDGAGNTAVDSSGKGQAGDIGGTAQWVEGKVGGGLMFDGKTNYIAVGNQIVKGTCSIALWIMPTGVPYTTDYQAIFHDDSWVAGAIHGHLRNTTSFVNLDVNGGGGVTSTTALQSNIWYHILGTFNVETGESKLYINGVQENAATGVSSALFLGPLNFGAWTKNSRFFPGAMDDIRIYDNVVLAEEIPGIMRGGQDQGLASGPAPKGGTTDVPRDTLLSWTAGKYAASHDVYFGTLFDDVNTASRTAPLGVLASQDQTATTFDPTGLLAFGQTYYWRVDEVNAAPDSSIYKGSVWDFTTEPYGYPVKPVKATASSSMAPTMGPDKTIDGSGLDTQDQHGTSVTQMWMSKKGQSPIWIQYEFDAVYKLYQMWVWNSNQAVELDTGFGAKDVKIETSTDGATWTVLANVPEFSQATGEPNYVHNTTVDFSGAQAKFVRLTITSNWADGSKQASLSEVRFFYVPVRAYSPTPSVGAANVALDAVLNWRPGREAAKHDVYVSADAAAVVSGTAPVKTITEHRLALATVGLEYARTYTWKVNEVNDAANPKSVEGDLWTFSTPEYGTVDDFESYNDTCNRIFFAWVDGYGHNGSTDCSVAPSAGNGSGSMVGNANPPFADRTVVHGGKQAMPVVYDNTAGKSLSEATRTFQLPQDWTLGGAKTLVLYFCGDSGNTAGQLYLKVNDKQVTYSGSAVALTTGLWTQWNIELASVSTNLKAVKTLSIGVSGSGKGILRVDDIRLYRAAPAVVVPADPGTSDLTLLYRMEGDVKDSSGKGNNGTAVGDPAYVDGPAGYGKALQFEGTDDHVEVPIGNLISAMTSCTVATWVNLNTSNAGSWERIFDFGTSSTAGYMFLSPRQGTNGAMRFAITTGTNTGESGVNSPTNLPAGWHHVAVVIDGVAKTLQLYLDGEVVASGPTAVVPKDLGKTTQNWLGRSQWSSDAYFAGILDDFRIYTHVLSTGEVRYLAGDR